MIQVEIALHELSADRSEIHERLGARFRVDGQSLSMLEGDPRWVQQEMAVPSERYGRMIHFDEDAEEWARNLPRIYRSGAVSARSEELPSGRPVVRGGVHCAAPLVLAEQMQSHRYRR